MPNHYILFLSLKEKGVYRYQCVLDTTYYSVMQSVPLTSRTNIVSSNLAQVLCTRCNIMW